MMEEDAQHAVSNFFEHLLQLKRDGQVDGINNVFQSGALDILNLKQVHRDLCESTEGLRDATADAKTQLDQSSLQLQNLLYEQQHYEKEIAECKGYKSAYSDAQLELIPVDTFKERWQVQRNELASEDAHQLMLNRLSHELMSREEMVKQMDAVKAKRDALAADVAQKRSVLSALEAEVAKMRAAAQQVQEQFDIPTPGMSDATRLAALLPLPLYILHSQLSAAAAALPDSCGVAVSVDVCGGEHPWVQEQLASMQHSSAGSAVPHEAPAEPPQPQGNMEAFPLSLSVTFRRIPINPGARPSLTIAFHLVPALNLLTAASIHPSPDTRAVQEALLEGLYPEDDGQRLPPGIPSTAGAPPAAVDVSALPGKPYRWVQHAAGMDLLPPLPPSLYVLPSQEQPGLALGSAVAAVSQYEAERRAAAVLQRLVEAVLRPKAKAL